MPLLAFNLNDGNEFVFDLTDERMGLGRASDNTININNSYISAHHAEFLRREDGVYELRDLGSSNGVRVNGKRIERVVLNDLDKVAFGQLEGRYYQEGKVATGGAKPAPVLPTAMKPNKPGVLAQLRAGKGGIPKTGVKLPAGSSAAESVTGERTVAIRKMSPEDFSEPEPVVEKKRPETTVGIGEKAVSLKVEEGERRLKDLEAKLERKKWEAEEEEKKKLEELEGELAQRRRDVEGEIEGKRREAEEEVERKVKELEEEEKRRLEELEGEIEKRKREAEGEVAALKLGVEKLVAEKGEAEEAVSYLEEKQGKLEERVAELDRVQKMGEEAEGKKVELASEVVELEKRVAFLKVEKTELSAAVEEGEAVARKEVEELEQRKSQLAGELADLAKMRAEGEAMERRLEEVRVVFEMEEKRLAELRGKGVELEKSLDGEVAELKSERDGLLAEKEQASAELEEMRKAVGDAEGKLDEVRGGVESMRAEEKSVAERVSEARAALENLEVERKEAVSGFERVRGEFAEMEAKVAALRDDERGLREQAGESGKLADRADELREECEKLELKVGAMRADAANLDKEAAERSMAEAVNAVRFAAGISPGENPARVLEGKVAEAEEAAKRLLEETEEEVATMKMQAGRYGKKSREFRRMEKEIRKGEKRLVGLEKKALRATERAAAASAVRDEEKQLRKALVEASREMEQVERSMKYLKEKEAREKAVVAEVEGEVAKLGGMRKELEGEIERVRLDMANLPEEGQKLQEIRGEVEKAEGRLEEIKEEVGELEERRKLVEVAVNNEEATVLLLGRELIKRVDLVDVMLNHYRYYEANPGVEEQLETFRASMLDMLKANSIWELAPPPETPVDIRLRKQMKIVETDGADVSKIVATIRPGFVYQTEEGREIVLRKVEVRTG